MRNFFMIMLMPVFVGGCFGEHDMSSIPATMLPPLVPLECHTPAGMIAVVAGETADLHMHVGGEFVEGIRFAVCNETDRAVGIDGILFTESRLDRPAMRGDPMVLPFVGFANETSTTTQCLSCISFDEHGVATGLFGDTLLIPRGTARTYALNVGSMDVVGEAEISLGLSSGMFATEGSFSSDGRPVSLDEVDGNRRLSRHVFVDP